MATTVQNAFEEFNKDVVNLDSNRTKKARASRDWLLGKLSSFDQKEGLYFPFEYNDKHIKFGSFARNTKIRELDDIDLMFCLKAEITLIIRIAVGYIIFIQKMQEKD